MAENSDRVCGMQTDVIQTGSAAGGRTTKQSPTPPGDEVKVTRTERGEVMVQP